MLINFKRELFESVSPKQLLELFVIAINIQQVPFFCHVIVVK